MVTFRDSQHVTLIGGADVKSLKTLFENNRKWRDGCLAEDSEFFSRLAQQQSPKYLWIGCSDSRVPANQIVGLPPGAVFVHRNIANVVVHTDFNCLSVLQFAVEVLNVEHIIVCGHYNCGGVRAALRQPQLGLIDNWLRHIKDVYDKHFAEIQELPDEAAQINRLCELNVREQVANVTATTIVQNAWHSGSKLSIHGWIYGLNDGLLRDLKVTVSSPEDVSEAYRTTRSE